MSIYGNSDQNELLLYCKLSGTSGMLILLTHMACTTSIPSSVLHYTLIKDVYTKFKK